MPWLSPLEAKMKSEIDGIITCLTKKITIHAPKAGVRPNGDSMRIFFRANPFPNIFRMNATNPWIYYTPFGLRALLNYLWKEYKVPILITENGCMDNDGEDLNDVTRIHYLRGHLMAIAQALSDGVPVVGHTVWSLMDNFEWFDGYTTKFGIHRVDFNDTSRPRTAKASAAFYSKVASSKSLEGFSITSRV